MDISLIATVAKRLGAVCLALVIFWHVARHAGAQRGTAIVHVPRLDVEVAVDDQSYRVESSTQLPLVCDLEPGRHIVKVRQGGVIVGEEVITIEAGKDVVLCPLTRPIGGGVAASGGSELRMQVIAPAGLAVHTHRPASPHN